MDVRLSPVLGAGDPVGARTGRPWPGAAVPPTGLPFRPRPPARSR